MLQQNESIVRRLVEEAWNRGQLAVVDDCVSPDFVASGPLDSAHGPSGQKAIISKYRSAFPDCHLEILEMISSGDRVVTRFRYSGTHKGPLESLPPTGRHVTGEGITIDRLKDGRIVESLTQWDALGMLQQLGVVKVPGAARAGV